MTSGSTAGARVDWHTLHQLKFVFEDGCWSTCGGHCCKTEHSDLAFALMGSGAGMVFFEEEFEYLRANGLLQEGFEARSKLFRFRFGEGQEARLWVSKCMLNGRCTMPESRPLLCKVYPYLPRVDVVTSEVTGFFQAAVFDQFWSVLAKPNPCTLVRERSTQVQATALPALRELVRHPYTLFYVKAAEHFIDAVAGGMRRIRESMPEATPRELTAKWEREYLSRRSFDTDQLRAKLDESYKAIKSRYPEFTL